MKTVANSAYKNEVELQFRSLASKVRMAIYETVPGYSVKNVNFYVDETTAVAKTGTGTGEINNTDATLFGTKAFYTSGTYTVSFPTIGSSNASESDYNKAHVAISGSATADTQAFGALNYDNGEDALSSTSGFLKRTSQDPSFAGTTAPYYVTMLPNEDGKVLEMRVNYTLVSNDGSNEEITIHGAKAFIPQVYTKWLPNYAYTYIFKISDNTNGWTNPTDASDDTKAGLFPITFDAVVLDPINTENEQTTITTVAMPSITTYQKGHVYSASDEYKAVTSADATDAASNDAIYVQVMNNSGALIADLNSKSFFYAVTGSTPMSEATVMDALNIRTSGSEATVVGRNGLTLTLTPATAVYNVTSVPGADGNWITQYNNNGTMTNIAAGMVGRLAPASAGTYAYVYQVSTGTATDVITAVTLTASPSDWNASDNIYYSDAACTTQVNSAYTDGTYYRKYSNLNNVYAVKVIKVQ